MRVRIREVVRKLIDTARNAACQVRTNIGKVAVKEFRNNQGVLNKFPIMRQPRDFLRRFLVDDRIDDLPSVLDIVFLLLKLGVVIILFSSSENLS